MAYNVGMNDNKAHTLLQGFRLGMLLQIAVGPICFFIFQTAATSGFMSAFSAVIGVALVDAVFILAALLGMGALIESKPAVRRVLKLLGSAVLILFGLNMAAAVFSAGFLPVIDLKGINEGSAFLSACLLTLSNPLTIVFWAGVFSQRLSDQHLERRDMALYGFGAVLSTLLFLSAMAVLGTLLNAFLSEDAVRILNLIVGLLLIAYGIRMALKKK